MDTVFINDLRIETIIGIYDWERKVRQTISLDLEMGTDIRQAAATDAIEDTLNYKAVAKRLIAFVEASEYQLVETLAEKIAAIVPFTIAACNTPDGLTGPLFPISQHASYLPTDHRIVERMSKRKTILFVFNYRRTILFARHVQPGRWRQSLRVAENAVEQMA